MKQFDCECYLRALEEQADNIGGAATSMMETVETSRRSAESMQRTVENLNTMMADFDWNYSNYGFTMEIVVWYSTPPQQMR